MGLIVFLGGIALLLLTFKLAYDMFAVPARDVLKLQADKTLDIAGTGSSLTNLIFRVLLLFVMALVSSFIANRGVTMYAASGPHAVAVTEETPADTSAAT